MKKINLHIANIGTKMKLKVGFVFVPNDSDTNTNYFRTIPTINKFSIGENHYINITVTPYVTIDISKGKDKNDSWSSNMQISFNRFQLFQFIRSMKKVIGAFNDPRVNLFMYRNNKLVIDTELSKELTLKSIGSSNKVAVIEPAIIQLTDVANNVDYYEGVNFYINSIDNYCSLTYDEFYYLEYELAKIDLNANTVMTRDYVVQSDAVVTDDVRRQEYNVVVLPLDLTTGDYIDIRLMLPNGQDFIVVSKKEVEIPIVGDTDSQTTMWVDLSEDEILHMSCAIVDAARVTGAKLYATKYTDPGMQRAATPTYAVNSETSALLTNNPNILESAMTELTNRYSQGNSANLRNEYIQPEIDGQGEQGQSNLETQMQDSITRSQEERVDYLEGLTSAAPATTTTSGSTTSGSTTTNTAQ